MNTGLTQRRTRSSFACGRSRLACERLEDRLALSTTVTTLMDVVDAGDNLTSLREAIDTANATPGADVIDFAVDVAVDGTLLTLTGGELLVSDDLTITGPGRDDLTIEGGPGSRLFRFAGGVDGAGDFQLSGVTLSRGQVLGTGGAINFESTGTLTLADSRVTGNSTLGSRNGGGAVYSADGSVVINDSEVSDNYTRGDYAAGGAVSAGGDLTITNSTVTGNATLGIAAPGGAFFSSGDVGATVEVTGSSLTMNRIEGYNGPSDSGVGGAAVATVSASVLVDDSDISNNRVEGALTSGGGVATLLGPITVRNSTINNNTLIGEQPPGGITNTEPGGAGLASEFGAIVIEDSTISGNTNNTFGTEGGGVYAGSGSVTVLRSTISGNSTTAVFGRGGGIRAVTGNVTVTDSTISGNSTAGASAEGGGISLVSGDLALNNSTVSGNSTAGEFGRGGGISSFRGDVFINNSTVTGNSAAVQGAGGVHVQAVSFSPVAFDIINSVIAGNTTTATGENLIDGDGIRLSSNDILLELADISELQLDVQFSLIGDNTGSSLAESPTPDASGNLIGGAGAAAIDPLLADLADNGGPTLTHLPEAGSPLLDAGDPAFDPSDPGLPGFDQRGAPFLRVAGGRLDIGAVEVAGDGGPALPGDYNGDNTVDAADFTVWRDTLNSSVDPFAGADGNGDGTIDAADYLVWRDNFGDSLPASSTASITAPPPAAPEPAGLAAGSVARVGVAPPIAAASLQVDTARPSLAGIPTAAVSVGGNGFRAETPGGASAAPQATPTGQRSFDTELLAAVERGVGIGPQDGTGPASGQQQTTVPVDQESEETDLQDSVVDLVFAEIGIDLQ